MEFVNARQAIADLVYTYALHIRKGNGAGCTDLFTEDAVFEVREAAPASGDSGRTRSRLTGREAIVSYITSASSGETRVCPMIHNLLIQVSGREAASTCVMTSVVWPTGLPMIGEYEDQFRDEDGWRFSSRVFTVFGEIKASPMVAP